MEIGLIIALLLAATFALVTCLIHFASSLGGSNLGYGFFRDELYFLVYGHHLAWATSTSPVLALQGRLAEAIFGLWPTGISIFNFLAGVTVGLIGLLTWQLGGCGSVRHKERI